MKNAYDILGVSPSAPEFVIRAAYHASLKRYHPDKYSGVDASEKTSAIVEAWKTLSDPEKRRRLDDQLNRAQAKPERPRASEKPKKAKGYSPPPKPTDVGLRPPGNGRSGGFWAAGIGGLLVLVLIASQSKSDRASVGAIEAAAADTEANMEVMGSNGFGTESEDPFHPVEIADDGLLTDMLNPKGLAYPSPAVDFSNIERGAQRFASVFEKSGMVGAREFSEKCLDDNQETQTWERTDFCAAFDLAADSFDRIAHRQIGMPRNAYFQFRVANLNEDYGRFSASSYSRVRSIQPAAEQVAAEALRSQVTQSIPSVPALQAPIRQPTTSLSQIEKEVHARIAREANESNSELASEVDADNLNTAGR